MRIHTRFDWTNAYGIGTGFVVGRQVEISPGKTNRVNLLITNKHMVGKWQIGETNISEYFDELEVFVYRDEERDGRKYRAAKVRLKDKNGALLRYKVHVHPDPMVDIAAVIFTWEDINSSDPAAYDLFHESFLLPFEKVCEYLGVGDQIFALGYPAGINSLKNNYPLAKAGYIAALPGEELSVDIGSGSLVTGKLFLIDGLILGGNSGGPVVIPKSVSVRSKGENFVLRNEENLVLKQACLEANLEGAENLLFLASEFCSFAPRLCGIAV